MTTVTVSGGVATFSALSLNATGTYTLAENAAGGLTGGSSASFNINPSRVGKLFFSVPPNNATAGSDLGPAVAVELLDSFGNSLTGDNTDPVTLTLTNTGKGPSVFAGGSTSLTVTVSGGVASFSNLVIDNSGTYTLAASAMGGVVGVQSNTFTISPAALSLFALSVPSSVTASTGFSAAIRARDIYGNTITTYPGSNVVALTCSNGQTVSPASVRLSSGRASALVTLSSPGTFTLSAAATVAGVVIRGTSSFITVNPSAPGPSTLPTVYSAKVFDMSGSGSSGALLGPADSPAASLLGQVTVLEDFPTQVQDDMAAQQYIADQENILQQQYNLPAGDSITTMDPQTGNNTVTQTPVGQATSVPADFAPIVKTVSNSGTPGAAASFLLSFPEGVNGVNTLADAPDPVTVTALDANNNVVSDYTGTVTLSSTDPGFGQPITYTFTPDDQGSHTFYVYLDTAGIEALTVTQSTPGGQGIASGQSGPQDGSNMVSGQGLVHIMPGTAINLLLGAPSAITAGSTQGITVTALDAFGNVVTGYTGTVTFLYNSTASSTGLSSSYTFTSNDRGSHLFPVTFKTTGSLSIVVSDTANSLISQQVEAQILPAPAKVVITSQPPTVVTAGTNFGLIIEAVDSHGTLDNNFNGLVTLSLAGNPLHGTLGGVVTVQAVNGFATFSGLTLNRAGAGYSLKASSGSATTTTTKAIAVTANTASEFVVISQPPSKVAAGRLFALKVAAEDGYGNVISSFSGSVTLTLASGPSGATVEGKLTVTLVKGVATFSGLKITQAGTSYSLTASGALTSATTNLFNVTAGAASRLAIGAMPQATITAKNAFGLVVSALDAYGNVANSYNRQVTLALVSDPGVSTLSGQLTITRKLR